MGFCWNTTGNPTPFSTDPYTYKSAALGSFTDSIGGAYTFGTNPDLTPSTTYYVKAYAYNGSVYYGSQVSFVTSAATTTTTTTTSTTTTTTTSTTTTTTTTTAPPGNIVATLQYLTIAANPARLNYTISVDNTTSTDYGCCFRIRTSPDNSTWSSYVITSVQTVYANTTNNIFSGLAIGFGRTNSLGDYFEVDFSTDNGSTYTGTISFSGLSKTLNFDYTQ